jgi:uncharacterized integral membrane protein
VTETPKTTAVASKNPHPATQWGKWILEHYRFILIVVCLLLFLIFLVKNSAPTVVWLFGWKPEIPLILIALSCFGIGLVCGWAGSAIYRKRKIDKDQFII